MDKPSQQEHWRAALESLPEYQNLHADKIPSFFFPHGHPGYVARRPVDPENVFAGDNSPEGRPVAFLKDFGEFLVRRYHPKAILIFSAHWESAKGEHLVSDFNDNPLLYDYYGFEEAMYREVGFKSRGDHGISQHVVTLLSEAGLRARLLGQDEPRGQDGRGFAGTGLDHGVFVPLSIMFPGHGPYDSHPFDIPVVQATIDGSMSIEANEALGKAVSTLRSEGVLILSGGLTVHTFEDLKAFREDHAPQEYKDWDQAITDAVNVPASASLKHQALQDLLQHPGCRLAHPRLEHFIPLYVAAGAGNADSPEAHMKVISGIYGATGIAFY